MTIQHKKNTPYYLAFPMVDKSTPESFKTGETVTDTAYYKDGAGAWTSLAIADTASEIGSTGVYEIDLTAAELNHDHVLIKMTATNSADTAFLFDLRTHLAEGVWDELTADHQTAGTYGQAFNGLITTSGTVSDVAANVHEFDSDLLEATDDVYARQILVMTSGSAKGEAAPILRYTGSTGKIRFAWPLRTAPANGDQFVVLAAGHIHPHVAVETYVGAVVNQANFILHDAPGTDDEYNGMLAVFVDSDTDQVSYRRIIDFVASTDTITVASAPDFTVAADDIVYIVGPIGDVVGNVTGSVADLLAIGGSTTAATQLGKSAATIVSGAATATTLTTTTMSTDLTEATDDHYNGRLLVWTSGALKDQATDISSYDGATKTLNFTAVTEPPAAGDTFVIV